MKFILALLASIFIVGVTATADPEIASIVSKMEKTKYGKTLLDTIALQVKAGDPVQDLINML